jgi:predicted hydrocarbon binding protein
MGTLSTEILEDLLKHLSSIVGDKAVNLLLKRIENRENLPQVVFAISEQIGEIFGQKGAYSVLRELGRTVARDLMANHPRGEWEEVFKKGLNLMGFAEGVEMRPDKACICSCVFYPQFLEGQNLKPTHHPVCWIGWGFVEGFMKALTGAKGVKFAERDFEKGQCWFQIINF